MKVAITMSVLESGFLLAKLEEISAWDTPLAGIYWQLVEVKKGMEKDAGVKKTFMPNGMVHMKDRDGRIVVRELMYWENKIKEANL